MKFLLKILKLLTNGTLTEERKVLVAQLQKEYEIVQNKVDKIGEFKFRVKGWSITIISALIAASFHKDYDQFIIFIGPLIVFVFHSTEYEQYLIQKTLGKLARFLERVISEVIKNPKSEDLPRSFKLLKSSPSIGRRLSEDLRRKKPKYFLTKEFWSFKLNYFYLIQYFILLSIFCIQNWKAIIDLVREIVLDHLFRLTYC